MLAVSKRFWVGLFDPEKQDAERTILCVRRNFLAIEPSLPGRDPDLIPPVAGPTIVAIAMN